MDIYYSTTPSTSSPSPSSSSSSSSELEETDHVRGTESEWNDEMFENVSNTERNNVMGDSVTVSEVGKIETPPPSTSFNIEELVEVTLKSLQPQEITTPTLPPTSDNPKKRPLIRKLGRPTKRPMKPKKEKIDKCTRCCFVSNIFNKGLQPGYLNVQFNAFGEDRNDKDEECTRCVNIFFNM